MDVVPEHGPVPAVVQQRGGDVLALLQRQVQALSLQAEDKFKQGWFELNLANGGRKI